MIDMLARLDKTPWSGIAARASHQAERLETLISQLLLVAENDSRRLAGRRRDVDVGELLVEVLTTTTVRDGIRVELEPLRKP